MELVSAENEQFMFAYPEAIDRVNLAIKLPMEVKTRELLAIVHVFDISGLDIASEVDGLSYSKKLDHWFRYIPPAGPNVQRIFTSFTFPAPVKRLSIQLYDWKAKKRLPSINNSSMVCLYPSRLVNGLDKPVTSIQFSDGGHFFD